MPNKSFKIAALYDGGCPSCSLQMKRLREYDTRRLIRFTDIAAPGFDADRDAGIPIERTADCLQVRMESGEVIQGSEALRCLNEIAFLVRSIEDLRPQGLTRLIGATYRRLARGGIRGGSRGTPRARDAARYRGREAWPETRTGEDLLGCPKASRSNTRSLRSATPSSSQA